MSYCQGCATRDAHVDALKSSLDAATARAERQAKAVDAIRAYAVASAETCRGAERERVADMAKRDESASIMPMLREQRYAWKEKASSYDALIQVIDHEARAALSAAKGEVAT